MGIVDTHSHIYLEQFNSDRGDVIKRAKDAGVEKILLPNIDVDSISSMIDVCYKHPELCFPMMGMHPTSVNKEYEMQLDKMYDCFNKHKFCAIGEVGIDLYWDKTFIEEQKKCFAKQLGWAKEFNLPVVIHARDAFEEIFQVMECAGVEGISGVFHSFSGTIEQAQKALSFKNFKLGINGVLTFKNSGLDKVVSQLKLEDLVLETDAPYLTPEPYRGKRNEPLYLLYIVDKVADIFKTNAQEVCRVTSTNANQLFNL